MQYYYNTQDNAVYIDCIHDSIPETAFKITAEQFKELTEARSKNMVVDFVDGLFVFKEPDKVYPDIPTVSEQEDALREVRNKRLSATDWTQIPDSPLAGDKDILAYRAALRAVPQTEGFPMVDLPIAPSKITV